MFRGYNRHLQHPWKAFPTVLEGIFKCSLFYNVLNDEACEHEAEDGGDMDEGAFALALGFDEFIGINALELT